MGFSYADWNDVFYPADLPPNKRLAYYSWIFNAVEVDSTFYGVPRPETVRRWAASTPPEFRFCLKVPRQITHETGLVGVQGDLLKFIAALQPLGDKLGALLFQFPPSFGPDRLPALQDCLAGLQSGLRYAVEIRHPSWYAVEGRPSENPAGEPALGRVLGSLGVCWAATEYPDLPRRIDPSSGFLYLRWIGQHGAFQRHDHERVDRSDQLHQWLQELQLALSSNPGVLSADRRAPATSGPLSEAEDSLSEIEGSPPIFGFFNNDYAGFAAATANRFKELAGLPVIPFLPPQQAKLF
jgi:uncharacterized protein YecE (DUF72 family)